MLTLALTLINVNAPKTYVKKIYKILSMHWFWSQPTNLSSGYHKIGS
jgi:hypothetical protein